jgi:hypothetical protein
VAEQFLVVSDENTRIELTAGVWLVSSVDKDPIRVKAGLPRDTIKTRRGDCHQSRGIYN